MKVYVINTGLISDWSDTVDVKVTLELARERALEEVAKINEALMNQVKGYGHPELYKPCNEMSPNYWHNNESFVRIKEFEI